MAEVVPEILSRLCCKCSPAIRERLLDFLLDVYCSEHRWKYQGVEHLTARLLEATPQDRQVALLPKLLQFPILDTLGPLERREFLNPFDFLEFARDFTFEMPELPDEAVDILFVKAASDNDAARTWAITTIGRLDDLKLLNAARLAQFGRVLWTRRDDDGMPSHTTYYRHAFLTLPHPADVDPVALFMEYARRTPFPAQASRTSTRLSIGRSSVITAVPLSPRELHRQLG